MSAKLLVIVVIIFKLFYNILFIARKLFHLYELKKIEHFTSEFESRPLN